MARSRAKAVDSAVTFKSKNSSQDEALRLYSENDILFLLGPAGTGKTFISVYCAVHDMTAKISTSPIERIIITRPLISAGEDLGALPGDINEKVHPYMIPIYDCVESMVPKPEDFIAQHVEIAPLGFMRGRSFPNCVAILDEAQNCNDAQLKLFMTRLGDNGKMIITGDPDQSDIGRKSVLKKVVEAMEGEPKIGVYRFKEADIVRHPLVGRVLARWPK